MCPVSYNWQRFWCPLGGTIDLSDNGFLTDPDAKYGRFFNKSLVTFKAIFAQPRCAILLGEPGMGKSHELLCAEETLTTQQHQVLRVDLGEYGTAAELERDLFEAAIFNQWLSGEGQFYLLLDSLDEGRMAIQKLAEWLVRKLRGLKKEHPACFGRLTLAIVCRTAVWPKFFKEGLEEIWSDSVKSYELAPLRRKDVEIAAEANGIPAATFLSAVQHSAIVPLAIKSVTLAMLLRLYQQQGSFPSDQLELYRKGLLLLCEETNDRRRDSTIPRETDDQGRCEIARYLAAVMLLSNNPAIWTGSISSAPEATLPIGKLSDEIPINARRLRVTENMLRDTLNTGLFSAHGEQRLGWAHRTYAEFLAAEYVGASRDPLTLFKQLFVHDGQVVPQLEETAAWLAETNRVVCEWLLEHDPEVLLRGSAILNEPSQKSQLVRCILHLTEQGQMNWLTSDIRFNLSRLANPGLADQLRPYLSKDRSLSARGLAVEIAEACNIKDLQDDLPSIALDTSEETFLRKLAARAVGEIANTETRAKLKPLLDDPHDEDDELKGLALQALWPEHLTANELFEHLTAPKRSSFFGAYQRFLNDVLPERLRRDDLPTALEWVEHLPDYRRRSENRFEKLVDRIALLAWEQVDDSEIRTRFARYVLRKAKTYNNIFVNDPFNPLLHNPFAQDEHKRRMLILEIVPHIQLGNDAARLAWCKPRLVLAQDTIWLVEQLATASENEKRTWARLISHTFDKRNPAHVNAILEACQTEPILADVFSPLVNPIDLDSDRAQELRDSHSRTLAPPPDPPSLEPPPNERIEQALAECESGNINAWLQLLSNLTLQPQSTHYGDPFHQKVPDLPGWQAADENTRQRIIRAGQQFLLYGDPHNDQWLGTDHITNGALAGYQPLRLLLHESPALLNDLNAAHWAQWAPAILAFPTNSSDPEGEAEKFTNLAYAHAPDAVIESLAKLLASGQWLPALKCKACLDDRLTAVLLDNVEHASFEPIRVEQILDMLFEQDRPEAWNYATALVDQPLEAIDQARIAAELLFKHSDEQHWPWLWERISRNSEFWKEPIAGFAAHSRFPPFSDWLQRFNENQLADLYIWLEQQFPQQEDPQIEGLHTVGSRENVAQFRDSIISHLRGIGTLKACEALERIHGAFPQYHWLQDVLQDARREMRRRTWQPPTAQELLTLFQDHHRRIVRNGDELLTVVIEAMERINADLQGEQPAARFLWNKGPQWQWRPKDENDVSDWLVRELRREITNRGIVINREVEIRRGTGQGTGERTDIHVDAVSQHADGECDTITVIIEVKGCWHPELLTAMETQLAGRYLKDNHQCRHGLYVVAWFLCDRWDKADSRYEKTKGLNNTREQMQQRLDQQAQEVSKHHGLTLQAFVLNATLR